MWLDPTSIFDALKTSGGCRNSFGEGFLQYLYMEVAGLPNIIVSVRPYIKMVTY